MCESDHSLWMLAIYYGYIDNISVLSFYIQKRVIFPFKYCTTETRKLCLVRQFSHPPIARMHGIGQILLKFVRGQVSCTGAMSTRLLSDSDADPNEQNMVAS